MRMCAPTGMEDVNRRASTGGEATSAATAGTGTVWEATAEVVMTRIRVGSRMRDVNIHASITGAWRGAAVTKATGLIGTGGVALMRTSVKSRMVDARRPVLIQKVDVMIR
jgi:hypothetical protein